MVVGEETPIGKETGGPPRIDALPPEADETDATELGRKVHSALAESVPLEQLTSEARQLVKNFRTSDLGQRAAAAETGVLGVEYTDPAAGIDLCYQFLDPVALPVDGELSAPTGHGLGVDVDWDLVAARSVGQFSAP